ncbi:hypothetical protein GQ44DRAFT_720249, partial [Phaeosphaeriaceae sp. PMI808]
IIDYAQESSQGGRRGKVVDSVILVEEKRATNPLLRSRRDWRALDQAAMHEFVQAGRGICRRAIMSAYIDGREVSCVAVDGARCDRCGEGVTEWHDSEAKKARERAILVQKFDKIANRWSREELPNNLP